MKETTKGKIAIITAATIWGFGVLMVRWIHFSLGHSVPTMLFGNFIFAILVFFLINKYKKIKLIPARKDLKWLLINGLTNTITVLTMIYALVLTTIANAEFLHYTMPIWAFLLAVFWLKEKITRWKLLALVLALVGIFLVFNINLFKDSFSLVNLGNILALISAFSYAITINIGRKVKHIPEANTSFWMQGVTTFILFFFFIFNNTISSVWDIPLFIFYSIISTIIPTLLFFYGLRRIEATTGSILMLLEAPVAIFLAWIILKETITLINIIGGFLILFGAIVLIKRHKNTTSNKALN